MNHKQKLGYMALGAGILALGIIIGQFVTPDIEAQNNGVFDIIQCRGLKVIDANGNEAIVLSTELITRENASKANGVLVLDKQGNGGGIGLFRSAQKTWIRVSGEGATESVILSVGEERDASISISDGLGRIAWEAP